MVSLQSALLPEAKRPPCLSLVDASTATSKKRKRDDGGGSDEDGIELNFDAAPLPLEWQRCLDIKSGQIHYYNTRTRKRTSKDPRAEPELYCAAAPAAEEPANCAPPGLDLELHLTFEPRRVLVQEKKAKPPAEAKPAEPEEAPAGEPREMVAAVCMRCHMLVMMCRACPACPNCKFLHPPRRGGAPRAAAAGAGAGAAQTRAPAALLQGLATTCRINIIRYSTDRSIVSCTLMCTRVL